MYRFLPVTEVEGPGRRACLWVQGCSIRCPGCFNPHMWHPDGGRMVAVEELLDQIPCAPAIEGVTFLGGEPFDQAPALAELGRNVQFRGLSIMTFTGYEYETLRASDCPGYQDLLEVTDLLIDGPYVREWPDHRRPWVGSTNQRFHFLTSRYRDLEPHLSAIRDRLEIRLGPDGSVWINGMADVAALTALRRDLNLRLHWRS